MLIAIRAAHQRVGAAVRELVRFDDTVRAVELDDDTTGVRRVKVERRIRVTVRDVPFDRLCLFRTVGRIQGLNKGMRGGYDVVKRIDRPCRSHSSVTTCQGWHGCALKAE